jgi:hypothetical protein
MKTHRVHTELTLQQTKLNRLKEHIIQKTEAIDRTVKQKAREQSATAHQTAIHQLQRSVVSAENTLDALRLEVEQSSYDDRTAIYQELDEELRASYLEYERLQGDVEAAKAVAQVREEELCKTDAIASPEHLADLREQIERVKVQNRALRAKWRAYQKKMHIMRIEARIAENRQYYVSAAETIKEEAERYSTDVTRLNRLADLLDAQNGEYKGKVDELVGIINWQRRRIVQHLMKGEGDNEGEE